MEATRLIEGYKSLLHTIYSPGEYYQRALDCLKRLAPGTEPKWRNPLRDLRTLARVILTLGVRDRERHEFWRYLGHVAVPTAKHLLAR